MTEEMTIIEEQEIEMWNGKEIREDWEFPMPTHCLREKKYDAKTYATLMTLSNSGKNKEFNNQMENRFVYKNSFDINELAQSLKVSRTTLQRNIKKLESIDCNVLEIKNTQNGIVYILNYGEKHNGRLKKYVTINQRILKSLACSRDNNAIKTYCLFKYMLAENSFKQLTNSWICEQIGLSNKSKNNLDVITEIVVELEKVKLIETRFVNCVVWDEKKKKEVPQIQKQYRLCSFKEWAEYDDKIRKKKVS